MKINFKSKIVLENSRVKLLPLNEEYVEDLMPLVLNNPNLLKYSPSKFGTKELLKEYIKSDLNSREKRTKYAFVIYDKVQEKYAGSTSYLNISEKDQRLEIGSTWIGKNFQRTGLNRNCKFLLMEYAFEQLNCQRLELKTDARNVQSKKAIEGIGAKYEGLLRSHMLMIDGHRRDTIYYSILIAEWPEIKLKLKK